MHKRQRRTRPYSRLGPVQYSAEYQAFRLASQANSGSAHNLEASRHAHSAKFPGIRQPRSEDDQAFAGYIRKLHFSNMQGHSRYAQV